uniref:V-type proton ATPase subunit C n=1 Tax=Arundo donax TaxID=35708 RepID=A0A0A9B9V1_ARUDO
MKVRAAEYNNVRSQLSSINRKQSGSLAVRDLSNLVKPEDMVTSEHLVTLLAIVPKYSQKDWLSSYELLDTFVVPRSSKKLYEDNEYALYTVTLFAKVVDNFKVRAREKGFQVRFPQMTYVYSLHLSDQVALIPRAFSVAKLKRSLILSFCFFLITILYSLLSSTKFYFI